jgi:hypothetical protein
LDFVEPKNKMKTKKEQILGGGAKQGLLEVRNRTAQASPFPPRKHLQFEKKSIG